MFTRRRMLRAGAMLLLLLLMGALALGAPPKEPLVTVDLRESKIDDALRMVLRDSHDSLIVAPGALQQGQKVSINLKAVPLSTAVRLVCNAAGVVGVRSKEGIWQITAPQAMIQVNNQQVPILGAVQVGSNNQLGPANVAPDLLRQLEAGQALGPPVSPAAPRLPSNPSIQPPVSGEQLINLQVADMPLPEALAKLRESSGLDVVAIGVPEKTRVTARVYLMPFTQFLGELAEQAGLAVQWEVVANAGGAPPETHIVRNGRRVPMLVVGEDHYRYYLVPFPTVGVAGKAPVPMRTRFTDFPRGEDEGGLTDLDVTDATLAQAVARLSGGYDVVVSEAVPHNLYITAKAYRVPAEWLLGRIASTAGLELREQVLDKQGKPLREWAQPSETEGAHTRYYLVPKSELKVTGSAAPVLPRALTGTPEVWEFRNDHGPVQLDPSHFVIGLLSSDRMSRQQARLVR